MTAPGRFPEPPTRKNASKWLYPALALAMMATVVWGFWRSYYGPLIHGDMHRPWIIHLHAVVFTAWMLLFLLQASLPSLGRPNLHRRIGRVAMAYGMVVALVGIAASILVPASRVAAGQMPLERASLVVLYNLTDIVTFGGFIAAAMYQRRRPESHRRLIICAVVALTGAAVGRVLPSGSLLYLLVWLLPLLVLIAIDLLQRRRPHPVSLTGIAVFAAVASKVAILSTSSIASRIGHELIGPFL
jgi:FtsH-binding integral membrane protein